MLVGGLLGAVALGAVAGARRTLSAYGRYLTASNASDVFVNVPGTFPGMAPTRPITLISELPGVTASAAYLGLTADPVVHGHIVDSFLTNDLTGSTGTYFSQDRMTGSRNALEPGSGAQAVPVRAALLGSVAAVTAVIVAVVFGTSLTGLVRHPVRYGWNWDVLIQAEGG